MAILSTSDTRRLFDPSLVFADGEKRACFTETFTTDNLTTVVVPASLRLRFTYEVIKFTFVEERSFAMHPLFNLRISMYDFCQLPLHFL